MSEENPKIRSVTSWKQSRKKCARRRRRVSSPSSTSPPWIELPGDVTANILQRLEVEEILESAQLVCTTWRKVCLDPSMWRVVEMIPPERRYDEAYELICRCVVERSQGQLVDLRIVYFGDDSLLPYIADRSSHLRCLTIVLNYEKIGTAFSEAVKKLPQLEELHLIKVSSITANDVEAIGVSCPMLKSFTYNCEHLYFHEDEDEPPESICNEYALAIGKTMPNLRHLRLPRKYDEK